MPMRNGRKAGMTSSSTVHDVIVIGSGPAGYTAAIYAARAQLSPLVFEGTQFGGALMTTTEVENYPGFRDGITGPELMDEMREQALRFGADLRMEDVDAVSLDGPIKTVTVGDETYQARAVILAMGAAARQLGVPGEEQLIGMGVSTCATCDGFFFRDQDIAVVGGGDSAMEEATFLTRFARSVTLIHRRDEFRASKIMLERARANEKIKFLTNTQVLSIEGNPKVSAIRLRNSVTGEESELAVTGVFVAIGHDPRSDLVRGLIDLDPEGYVVVKGRTTSTSIDGVFAAGDLVDHTYRQAITAAGSGCAASIDAERWLAETTSATTDDSTDLIGAPL
jgi:thioredoxin reductase (NADPH)